MVVGERCRFSSFDANRAHVAPAAYTEIVLYTSSRGTRLTSLFRQIQVLRESRVVHVEFTTRANVLGAVPPFASSGSLKTPRQFTRVLGAKLLAHAGPIDEFLGTLQRWMLAAALDGDALAVVVERTTIVAAVEIFFVHFPIANKSFARK